MGLKRSEKISESIEIGRINTLKIYKKSEYGLFLRSGDMSEILLPNAYVEKEMRVGESVKVFCYHDSQDRPVATTRRPVAMLDEYGLFEVVDYRSYGAFVKWGLPKDLFVPLSQQKVPVPPLFTFLAPCPVLVPPAQSPDSKKRRQRPADRPAAANRTTALPAGQNQKSGSRPGSD